MNKPTIGNYLVLCRAERKADGEPGDYELATRKDFRTSWQAAEYRDGLSTSREPIVVLVIEVGSH